MRSLLPPETGSRRTEKTNKYTKMSAAVKTKGAQRARSGRATAAPFERRLEQRGRSFANEHLRKENTGSGECTCKGPDVGPCLQCSEDSKEASVARVEWEWGEWVGLADQGERWIYLV